MITLDLILSAMNLESSISEVSLNLPALLFLPLENSSTSPYTSAIYAAQSSSSSELLLYQNTQNTTLGSIQCQLSASEFCHQANQKIETLNLWLNDLNTFFFKTSDMQKFIETLNTQIPNPIVVLDTSHKVLGFSDFFDVSDDSEWEQSLTAQFVDLSRSRLSELMDASIPSSENSDAVYTLDSFAFPFFHQNIYYGNSHVGHYSIIEQYHPLSDFEIKASKWLSPLIAIMIDLNNTEKESTRKHHEYLLKDILINPDITSEEVEKRLFLDDHSLKPPFAVCSIPAPESDSVFLNQYCINSISFRYREHFIFLIEHYDERKEFQLKKQLSVYLKELHLQAGFSRPFTTLFLFKNAYLESIKALHFHQENPDPLCFYETIILQDFFHTAAVTLKHPEHFFYPQIRLMQQEHRVLFETLKAYLENLNNQKATALAMGIHRSTLIYRIQQIKKRYSLDLDDSKTLLRIQVTLHLMEATPLKEPMFSDDD